MNIEDRLDKDYIDDLGYYVIKDYDKKSTFSSFLSAIAGIEGIPMWSFYVNRGQAISSIGIKDKDNCMMEFFPANEAYKMVTTNGFRTFIKIKGDKEIIFEPFSPNSNYEVTRYLKIKNNEIRILEENNDLNIDIEVTYYTVPKEPFAAFARKLKIFNKSNISMNVEIIDGVSSILPYGSDNQAYKEMSNTLRSWMRGEIKDNKVAIYKLSSSTGDTTKVEKIDNAYFYLAFDENNNILNPIVDKDTIFGYDASLLKPKAFEDNYLDNIFKDQPKVSYNKVPCAFSGKSYELNDSIEIYSYLGYMNSADDIDKNLNRIVNKEYFEAKRIESNKLIDEISKHVNTVTNYPLFDEYIKQCYIDNVLRGGYPIKVGDDKVYYVYSRKHGDLERDYNFFTIEPNFYSQGNGNFRDVNQNRRMDTYIHPFVEKENIKLFNNLIQLDGYNPLVIKGKNFRVATSNNDKLKNIFYKNSINDNKLIESLNDKFTIGELYAKLKDIDKVTNLNEVINEIISISEDEIDVDFGEGFWIDHWTYNLDLIEEYLDVYPDKIKELLYEDSDYIFFNSPEYVLPRKKKYVVEDGKLRQYLALSKKENNEKWLNDSKGNLYKTNLISKLFILSTLKFSSLDMYGYGIEMEAGKPGWNDAMNGLPGILGSSFAETAELKRLLEFIQRNINILEGGIKLPIEICDLLKDIDNSLDKLDSKNISQLDYWNRVSNSRELFREKTKNNIDGLEEIITSEGLKDLLNKFINKIDKGISEIKEKNNNKIPTFIYYDVKEYKENEEGITPVKVEVNFLPDFLEGYARYLKTDLSEEEKTKIYKIIRDSDIYDKKLKMYKTSESLEEVTFEIGRARSFTAGWLERESIFMHMEFKYILQLIKQGLYTEFFEDIKNVLPAFMNPEVYGRSILENSSFIASSANPDERVHGKGFVARLSGTTVEMLNIWKIMMVGENIFRYENGILEFKLSPILSKDFFKENKISTTLLGSISLTYINDSNKNTFGENRGVIERYKLIYKDNKEIEINSNKINGSIAEDIRNNLVKDIIVFII
ncbi:hypothetical protein [Clostridium sp.]|uniref:hypothetical protein n=1 Tax=Clostridium sp. TaxID=1506 RepID=UPI001D8E102D|nr:hypothetical protein [Clostridium sp.]MBS5937863.1 hypothetical protein [Clostridium sp.]